MPAIKCDNGKWKFGETGACKYDSEEEAINDNAEYYENREMNKFNEAAYNNASKLIKAGDINEGDWDFTAQDGNELLGDDNWSEYRKWFLAIDTDKNEESKAHYGYPFGKNGKVYRKALIAIRQYSGRFNLDSIFDAAGRLIDMIDADKKNINIWDEKFNDMEKRIYNIETRTEEREDGTPVVIGHASLYNTRSANLGGFYEVIKDGAFTSELIDKSDVRALINHDQNLILGRSTSGTLKLDADEKGLRYEFDVPQTSYGKDLLISMKRGDITQSSFAFTVADDTWETDDDGNSIRTIKKIDRLYDVSPVTYPAYPEVSDIAVAQRGLACYKEKIEKKEEEKDLVARSLTSLKIELAKRK